jgi:hypothetical protein
LELEEKKETEEARIIALFRHIHSLPAAHIDADK